jgi:protein ImuB
MLWLALYFPGLPLEVHAREDATTPRVVATPGRNGTVFVANAAARATGIVSGLPLSSAWALSAALRVFTRNEREEQSALERCAGALLAYTPLIVPAPPAVLLAEIEGSAHLFGGVAALRARVCKALAEQGYTVRPALAPTPLAATWLARRGIATDVRTMDKLRAALEPLPVSVLDPVPAHAATLAGIGIRTLGDCLQLPRPEFARRFGAGIRQALDRALGIAPDPRKPFTAPAVFRSATELPAPVSEAAALIFAARRLIRELADFLTGTGRGVTRFTFELTHTDCKPTSVEIALAGASRDAQRLERLMRERFERLELVQPVETIALAAIHLRPLAASNQTLFPDRAKAAEDAAQLIERLRARLGVEAVQGLSLLADHRPERAWRCVSREASPHALPQQARPLWLLAKPQVLPLRGGKPCIGEPVELLGACERLESGWWDGDAERDYFVAGDDSGARYWIYRTPGKTGGAWHLHGVFG